VRFTPDPARLVVEGTILLPPGERTLLLAAVMADFSVWAVESGTRVAIEKLTSDDGETNTWRIGDSGGDPLAVRFTCHSDAAQARVFGVGADGAFAGGINTCWYPQPPSRRGVGTVAFVAPPGWTAIVSGEACACGREEIIGTQCFRMTAPSSFSFACGRYERVIFFDRISLEMYTLKPRPQARAYLEQAARVLQTLEEEFGPYPYGKRFALVEIPDEQARAAKFLGASLEGFLFASTEFFDKPFNLAFWGHEISHQWWGNQVRHRGTTGVWLKDEAMAQWGSLRAVEQLAGVAAAAGYRREGYPGYIARQSTRGYLEILAAGQDHPLTALAGVEPKIAQILADGKAFQVFDLFALWVGREQFRRRLQNFVETHAFQESSWDAFRRALVGNDPRAADFITRWFERPGIPTLGLEWRQSGALLEGAILQTAPYWPLPLEIEVITTVRSTLHLLQVDRARTPFRLPIEGRVRQVRIDPHHRVPRRPN
jgi:aminopeptidase N